MDHGLSQYEARERLLWFLFLLLCLLMALPAVWIHLAGVPRTAVIQTTSEALKSYTFWAQRQCLSPTACSIASSASLIWISRYSKLPGLLFARYSVSCPYSQPCKAYG